MYRLLLVDDEEEIRRGIAESIDWNSWGYTIVGEASDGEEAIELISKTAPDVILSDIRMPGMDGVVLMKHIYQNHPEIKLVVLSGYSDYAYMKESIQSGVVTYLLKPTDIKEFEKAFKQIYKRLEQEKQIKIEQERQTLLAQKGDSYLASKNYSRYLFADTLPQDNESGFFGGKTAQEYFNGSRVGIAGMPFSADYFTFISAKNKAWLKEQAAELLQKELDASGACRGTVFINGQNIITFFAWGEEPALCTVFESAFGSIQKSLGIDVVFGISPPVKHCNEIPCAYLSARGALNKPDKGISFCTALPCNKSKLPFNPGFPEEAEITGCLLEKNYKKLWHITQEFYKPFFGLESPDYHEIDFAIIKYLLLLADSARHAGFDLLAIAENGNARFDTVHTLESLTAKQYFVRYIISLVEKAALQKPVNSSNEKLLHKIRVYIDENYCSEQLSLELVADAVQKNPAYVSRFFKESYGMNFSEYVRKKRMEEALRLLRDEHTKIYETAQRVGYVDVSSFMKAFKKHYGVTPSEYQVLG